ncbi:MAG: hypothetical protein II976_09025, partial [Alistipes sp.]|nr:hypothetical protein [Alistipes sp.]
GWGFGLVGFFFLSSPPCNVNFFLAMVKLVRPNLTRQRKMEAAQAAAAARMLAQLAAAASSSKSSPSASAKAPSKPAKTAKSNPKK